MEGANASKMIEVVLGRIVIREQSDRQYIFLQEKSGKRGFPIVIGSYEAAEIQRVVAGIEYERPLTHQLALAIVVALGARLKRCDIVDLRQNTFFAQLVVQTPDGKTTAVVDARPSDAIALALRAGASIRVAEHVLDEARSDDSGPDPLPPPEEPPEPPGHEEQE